VLLLLYTYYYYYVILFIYIYEKKFSSHHLPSNVNIRTYIKQT